MAETILLIFVFAVIGITFLVTRFIYGIGTTIVAWVVAGVILSAGIGAYLFNKVEQTGETMESYYEQAEE